MIKTQPGLQLSIRVTSCRAAPAPEGRALFSLNEHYVLGESHACVEGPSFSNLLKSTIKFSNIPLQDQTKEAF